MRPLHAIILAAGLGKRMRSQRPKVLHEVLHRPLLLHVLAALRELKPETTTIVVGHGREAVEAACGDLPGLRFAVQTAQKGTGDAVRVALEGTKLTGDVLVLCGDTPCLRGTTLSSLVELHRAEEAAATMLTANLPDPGSYGRILRGPGGNVLAIREARDCSAAELLIPEVNSGVYVFEAAALSAAIPRLEPKNAQNELYLTDAIGHIAKKGPIFASVLDDEEEMSGVNDRLDLAEAEAKLSRRVARHWMAEGVTILRPETVSIDTQSKIGPDVWIEANCTIIRSHVETGAYIEANSRLVNAHVGNNSRVKQGCYVESSKIGADVQIGPYAHLRPGTELADGVRIGNFVELKKTKMGRGSKASHLSYLGDAEVGANVNIGCGFVTCNFDGGPVKHKTTIEDGAFIGSDSQVVAPVTIGKDAYVGSGSTITRDVPAGALAVSRARQENIEGYVERMKKRRAATKE